MKKIFTLSMIFAMALATSAQSLKVHNSQGPVAFNISKVDSITFNTANAADSELFHGNAGNAEPVPGHWLSLGTSITWYNSNVSSAFTKGYQTRVMEKLAFEKFTNNGVNGGVLSSAKGQVIKADYYTIEHGVNDWGHSTPVGTMKDYINNTKNGTFAAEYRQLIDKIYQTNAKAMIILCTPRKSYGFGTYLPAHWYDPYNNIYLEDYAKIIREIAAYESLPVADFFALCGNQHNLDQLSIDKALHPNDAGYQLMANVLVEAFKTILLP